MRADAMYNIRDVFDFETFWYFDMRYVLLFQAECLTALQAGQMYMLALMMVMMAALVTFVIAMIFCCTGSMFLTYTIFMLATSIINHVKQLFLGKESQRAEEGASINGWE